MHIMDVELDGKDISELDGTALFTIQLIVEDFTEQEFKAWLSVKRTGLTEQDHDQILQMSVNGRLRGYNMSYIRFRVNDLIGQLAKKFEVDLM